MFGSIYSGLSGLLGFSKGLEVISNNIANMNTPGYKSSELAFRDLFYRFSTYGGSGGDTSSQIGNGVDTPSTRMRFQDGELRETGNALDAAIDGNGMFVLRRDGDLYYTRAGQFELDTGGYLVDRTSNARVMGLTGTSTLEDINITSRRTSAPAATSLISFIGNLSRPTSGTTALTHDIKDVTVYDSTGEAHKLQFRFVSSVAGIWTVEATEPPATTVLGSGEIRYEGNGMVTAGYNTVSFTLAPAGKTASTIVLNFGEPGSFSGSTGLSGGTTSDLKVSTKNGSALGSLTKVTYDEKGYLKLVYSNGETAQGQRLALAWFRDLQKLEQVGDGLFVNNTGDKPILHGATTDIMGKVIASKVELSNVKLTEQFTDMVIIQRGYQASSQVTTVANEMIQQLMDMRRRG